MRSAAVGVRELAVVHLAETGLEPSTERERPAAPAVEVRRLERARDAALVRPLDDDLAPGREPVPLPVPI